MPFNIIHHTVYSNLAHKERLINCEVLISDHIITNIHMFSCFLTRL